VDLAAGDHPLRDVRHELQAKGLCEELVLGLLSRDDVVAYVGDGFAGSQRAARRRLAARVHERTEGNALFMVNVLHDLVDAGLLTWRDGRWQGGRSVHDATGRRAGRPAE